MSKFMDYTHPDAFVDHPKRLPVTRGQVECPRCKGHGGWNLELNAYPLHNRENTPENRHKYSHFRAACDHCNGWGYVSPKETCKGHDWKFVKNIGWNLNRYECVHCKMTHDVDSSG